jgi:AcrR family transcriptional regulator
MSPEDRLTRRKMRTRLRLLDAAEQVFSDIGFQDATVLDITEAADVSKRTFYLHFDDKQAIIEAIALRGFQQVRQQIEESEEKHSQIDDMRVMCQYVVSQIFEFCASKPDLMQVVFGEGGSYRLREMTLQFIARAWLENFEVNCNWNPDAPVPPEILSQSIAGVILAMMSYWVNNPGQYTPEQMATMCASVMFDSIEINYEKAKDILSVLGEASQ